MRDELTFCSNPDVIAEQKPLADKIYKELLSRVKETDIEPPYKNGEYYYMYALRVISENQIHVLT